MTDILLAKPKLPPDFIDLSVGEPYVVRDILLKHFSLNSFLQDHPRHVWEYPFPTGYQPLVSLLEEKYGHPVIITNGAKQALGACFYALKKMGKQNLGMMEPYWALIPPLVLLHGLTPAVGKHPYNVDAFLALAPNNPDGQFPDLECLEATCKSKNIPLIHDAAYYTHVYLPPSVELKVYGDAQIYSISKMFGLSGLRLGYVVCPNHNFYQYIQEYMETMTVGVSITSQIFLYDLLAQMKENPDALLQFEDTSAAALAFAKQEMLKVNKEVLHLPQYSADRLGMFGWYATGSKFDAIKAKLNFIDGTLFGGNCNMVRMNLAWGSEQIQEIVRRLNSLVLE
jgi:aspartate/methionine/tyrosine aminotransferase